MKLYTIHTHFKLKISLNGESFLTFMEQSAGLLLTRIISNILHAVRSEWLPLFMAEWKNSGKDTRAERFTDTCSPAWSSSLSASITSTDMSCHYVNNIR